MGTMTLDEAVGEVLNYLTGYDLHYVAELDRYRSITRTLNRALRLVSTEHEWSCYSSIEDLGELQAGQTEIMHRRSRRPRIIHDDSVRLVDADNHIHMWAYILPRESLHKYQGRTGLWVASTENKLEFSRPIRTVEAGLRALAPVMREPRQLVIPASFDSMEDLDDGGKSSSGESENVLQLRNFHNPDIVEEWVMEEGEVPYAYTSPESSLAKLKLTPQQVRLQSIDHSFPDLIILKAAALYAATDPLMQPRVQTLDAQYKSLFYALTERDTNRTDDPYRNDFHVPIQGGLHDDRPGRGHAHPHSDERRFFNYY